MSNFTTPMASFFQGFSNQMDVEDKRKISADNLARFNKKDDYAQERLQIQDGRNDEEYKIKMDAYETQIKLDSRNNFKTKSFEALDSFIKSGSVHRLNYFLKENIDNPITGEFFADVAQFQRVNKEDLSDVNLKSFLRGSAMDATGVTEAELDAADGFQDGLFDIKAIRKAFVKQVNKDGTTTFLDIDVLASVTGYSAWADDKSREMLGKNNMTSQMRNIKAKADALGIPVNDYLAQERKREDEKRKPTKNKIIDTAANSHQKLNNMNFFDMEIEEITSNPTIMKHINNVELANKLSETDRKMLIDLSSVATSAKDAATLEAGDVGFIDDKINQVLNITTEKGPDGLTARSAYGAMINVIRHELFGSAQTDGEIAAFRVAYNHLGTGIVPVLQGLKQAMGQTLAKLKTVAHLNHPVIVKRYMGSSSGKMSGAVETLEKKIAFYSELADTLGSPEYEESTLEYVGFGGEERDAKVEALVDELRVKHGLAREGKDGRLEVVDKVQPKKKDLKSSVFNNVNWGN